MRIAVLMSSYNGERYLREQVESILMQELDMELDLWVRDDGSRDSTRQILDKYQQSGKLRWYAGDNLRPAKSFLDLLRHCPGYDFYAFADQDDVWYPHKLARAVRPLVGAEGPAMYFANARLVDGSLGPLGRNVYRKKPYTDFYSLVCSGGILGCTMCFNARLAALVQEAPSPERLIMHDAYIATVCAMFDGSIFYDSDPQMDYRQHGNNVVGSKTTKLEALKDRLRAITTPRSVSIAEQAESMLSCYPQLSDPQKKAFLQQAAGYRKSVFTAVGLALSAKPHFNGKNMAVTGRLAIALRNR